MKRKFKLRLLPKFIISIGLVGLVLTVAVSLFSYFTTKSYLENMYADRVMTNCNTIAAMLDADDVKTVISEGGDATDEYRKMRELFNRLKKENGVAYLSLTVPYEDRNVFYIDAYVEETDDPDDLFSYGHGHLYSEAGGTLEFYKLALECFKQNKGVDHTFVTDNKYGYNYTGIAVVLDENGTAIADVQYILDMNGVRAYLNSFLTEIILISFAVVAVLCILYIFFVRNRVTKPVGKLTAFTNEITASGVFENKRIDIKTGDEIQSLSESFNFMLAELENYIANLSKVTSEKERIGAELDIATHIQKSMLPCIFPAFPERSEFDVFATMDPAKEVGGDFYDFFMVDDRHLAIVMADVSGKGVPAALFMVIGKTLIKDHTQPGRDLGDVFSEVNDILCESNSEGLFITAFEGVLDLASGEFKYVNAGHEMPFICRNGSFEAHKIKAGFVLAGMEGMKYRAGSLMLNAGDQIFQYTDGVTEATNAKNELYGMDRLSAVLNREAESSPEAILSAVKADIDLFVGNAPQFDDITMLCLKYKRKMEESGNAGTDD